MFFQSERPCCTSGWKNVYGLIGVPIFQDTGLISSQLFIQHVKLIGINLRLKLRIIPGGYEKFIAFIALYKLRRKQVSILMQEGIAQVPLCFCIQLHDAVQLIRQGRQGQVNAYWQLSGGRGNEPVCRFPQLLIPLRSQIDDKCQPVVLRG